MGKTAQSGGKVRALNGWIFLIVLLALPLPVYLFGTPELLPGLLAWDCPLLHFTGIPCAGCGMTRAFFAFFHGDVIHACRCNPLFILPLLAWLGMIGGIVLVLCGRPLPRLRRPGWWVTSLAFIVIVFWMLRVFLGWFMP